MERLPCPGPAELNNSSAKNGNGYLTSPEAAWLHHLDLARNTVIEHLTSGVRVEQAQTVVDMDAGEFCHIQNSHRLMAVLTNRPRNMSYAYNVIKMFTVFFLRHVTTPLYYWIWNDPDFDP